MERTGELSVTTTPAGYLIAIRPKALKKVAEGDGTDILPVLIEPHG
jgi:hypothetical protein